MQHATMKSARLAHHLRVAAAAYSGSAEQHRLKGNERLYLEFRRLEKECYDFADALEAARQLTVNDGAIVANHNLAQAQRFPDTQPFEG